MSSPGDGARPSRPVIAGPIPIPAAISLALAFLLAFAPSAGAQTAAPGDQPVVATESSVRELQTRIEELERRLGASALLELAARVDRLTKEVQELRDHAEVQARTIKALQSRQQDLYAELDRLAQRLARPAPEVGETPPDTGAAPSVPAAEPGADTAAASPGEKPEADESGETGPAAPDDATSGDPERAPARPSPYDPVEEQARYQLAFDLLSEGRFERAANSFTDFLADFPESRYRDNARFWKGECLYALRRFEPALEEFRSLVASHPDSPRIPGARLKIGFILQELGRSEEAAEELRALVEAAPDSSEAKLARDRLERLQ